MWTFVKAEETGVWDVMWYFRRKTKGGRILFAIGKGTLSFLSGPSSITATSCWTISRKSLTGLLMCSVHLTVIVSQLFVVFDLTGFLFFLFRLPRRSSDLFKNQHLKCIRKRSYTVVVKWPYVYVHLMVLEISSNIAVLLLQKKM